MDSLDKKIISRIQKNFPLEKKPFKLLGEEFGISDNEIIKRLEGLKKNGYIRRLGAIFDSKKLGFSSTLCAMKVPPEKLEETAAIVSGYVEVTHNYQREASYNLWFTLVAENQEKVDKILKEISRKSGIREIRDMPATSLFKINVNLQLR